ncbi:MAG: hypothetical protein EOO14_15520 [Chitinophagaceae bacterium]|nr:MAG: hypothetical protein EOO14_15520 [Chitinophagaceae bacterium]
MEKRFHQISMLLLSRLWVNYIGFITGMILAIVGAAFILGKLRISASELSTKFSGTEVTLKTASPGLLLCVLGCTLMITTLVVRHEIQASHKSVYLHEWETNAPDSITPPPFPALPPSPH